MTNAYFSTHDLRDRYRCSSRTIFRRMKREQNPFPKPCIKQSGACNLWNSDDILQWEETEKQRTTEAA